MKKLGFKKIVIGLFVSCLAAVSSFGSGNDDDFTLSKAKYMNFTGKDECLKSNAKIYDKVMRDNHLGVLPYIGGVAWNNDIYSADVFTNENYDTNGNLQTIFFYNSLNACTEFNKHYDELIPYIRN
jgi:hypothetical protein